MEVGSLEKYFKILQDEEKYFFSLGPTKTGNNVCILLLILQLCCVIWSSWIIKKMIFTWHSKVQSSSVWQFSQQLPTIIGHETCFSNKKKTVKTIRSSYEERLKCCPSVFNVWIKIIRRSPLLARFWLFASNIALKMLGSLHESVSFDSEDKNASGKPFVSSLKNMKWWEMALANYLTKLNRNKYENRSTLNDEL